MVSVIRMLRSSQLKLSLPVFVPAFIPMFFFCFVFLPEFESLDSLSLDLVCFSLRH